MEQPVTNNTLATAAFVNTSLVASNGIEWDGQKALSPLHTCCPECPATSRISQNTKEQQLALTEEPRWNSIQQYLHMGSKFL